MATLSFVPKLITNMNEILCYLLVISPRMITTYVTGSLRTSSMLVKLFAWSNFQTSSSFIQMTTMQ